MDTKKELIARLEDVCPEAREQIAAILADYRITRETGREKDLQKRITSFLAAKKIDGLSAKTLKNYREMLGAFAARVDKPVARINADDIREYIGYLAEERRLQDSSIQTHISTLRSFFSWLDIEDVIKRNPMRRIKSLKIDKMRSRRPLTAEQLEQLRDGCRTYKEKALVEFLVSSGCRLSEAVGLRVDAVDWQGRSVVVRGKGNKDRTVYFSVRAKLMLQEYLAQRKGGVALFANSRAPYGPMQARGVERILQQIGERAGEERRIHPHLLGHTDPKTTLIYAELAPRTVQYEYDRILS